MNAGALHYRRATADDAEALARLRFEFRSALGEVVETPHEFLTRCTAWMERRLRVGEWLAWVAADDGGIHAHLWLHTIEKIPNPIDEPEAHAYITNVFVQPSLRGQGVGAQLVSRALEWCRAHDVDRVILWPTDESRSLYRRNGFSEPDDLLELTL